jgi:hypothetical protein
MKYLLCFTIFFLAFFSQAKSANWKQISQKNGITVFKSKVVDSKIQGFRGETYIYSPVGKILHLLINNESRKKWVDRLKTSKIIQTITPFEYILHQEFQLPWPIKNRDFVYNAKAQRNSDGKVILTMKSTNTPKVPGPKGVVRAELINSRYIITPLGKYKSKLEVEIFSDPKGIIPKWLVNIIQKSWPVKTLMAIKLEVEKDYVKNHILPPLIAAD